MSACNYCHNEHGIIGDVVCPVKKPFYYSYVSKPFFAMEIHLPIEKYCYKDFVKAQMKRDFDRIELREKQTDIEYRENYKMGLKKLREKNKVFLRHPD